MDGILKKNLERNACLIRKGIIEGTFNAKSGHPGLPLGCAPIAYALYQNFFSEYIRIILIALH